MTSSSLEIVAPLTPSHEGLFTPEARQFLSALCAQFAPRVETILAARRIAAKVRSDHLVDAMSFPSETKAIRDADWRVAPLPADLQDRRVEMTGPVSRKMLINGLNSGARLYMADFEDASSPTWRNMLDGQVNLREAILGTISFTDPTTGKHYALNEQPATLIVRPRGWHLPEAHIRLDNAPIPGCLMDFGLYLFHNAQALLAKGSGPYFYLPKLEHYLEARLWNDVFIFAQSWLGLPLGTIKATVLVETLPAAFQMDEILYELREHSAGLNCGRWDYIFSALKCAQHDPNWTLPDRHQVTMTQPFMRAYTQRVIQVCHRRGVHAMGGMAPQIPARGDPERTEQMLAKVREDKEREARDGHDGTWVAHPGLVATARAVFDEAMPGPNQIDRPLDPTVFTAADLLQPPAGTRTLDGLKNNMRVGTEYLEAWLTGSGASALYGLMEDAATAEIARTQVWQWLQRGVTLEGLEGPLTTEQFNRLYAEEMRQLRDELGAERFDHGQFDRAQRLFVSLCTADTLPDFLTLPAYDELLQIEDLVAKTG